MATTDEVNFWVSWTRHKVAQFPKLTWPHWKTANDPYGHVIYCAAVRASSATDAINIVTAAHTEQTDVIEWRFVEKQADDWTPFNEQYQHEEWMTGYPALGV